MWQSETWNNVQMEMQTGAVIYISYPLLSIKTLTITISGKQIWSSCYIASRTVCLPWINVMQYCCRFISCIGCISIFSGEMLLAPECGPAVSKSWGWSAPEGPESDLGEGGGGTWTCSVSVTVLILDIDYELSVILMSVLWSHVVDSHTV